MFDRISEGRKRLSSHGYVLVRVGKDHHLADANGEAYEHRLVAERILGRELKPGEIIHHKNGIKTDNSPENIAVMIGNEGHGVHHRTVNLNLQMPGEPNQIISCKCGCGRLLDKYDQWGRPREYISGHNVLRDSKGQFYVEAKNV